MTRMIEIPFEDAQRIFDLAVAADNACSGYMETDDVKSMRRLAVALGVDPAECTSDEFVHLFPHTFEPSFAGLNNYRKDVYELRYSVPPRWRGLYSVNRPETDAEVIARVGTLPEVCGAGRRDRCNKPADDPIHTK